MQRQIASDLGEPAPGLSDWDMHRKPRSSGRALACVSCGSVSFAIARQACHLRGRAVQLSTFPRHLFQEQERAMQELASRIKAAAKERMDGELWTAPASTGAPARS